MMFRGMGTPESSVRRSPLFFRNLAHTTMELPFSTNAGRINMTRESFDWINLEGGGGVLSDPKPT